MEDYSECCIVIPVYKENLTQNESASLKQAITILKGYKFYFVCAHEFDPFKYIEFFKQDDINRVSIKRFDNTYFKSLDGYNRMLLSKTFYQQFTNFQFILIYQLDAWVFTNDLEYWCNKSYDYVGAPWFEGFYLATEESKVLGVGNGGFSLRKVSTYLQFFENNNLILPFSGLWKIYLKELLKKYFKKVTVKTTFDFLKKLLTKSNTTSLVNNYNHQEDHFWGSVVAKNISWFKIPKDKIASQFSMEVNAPLLYKQNGNRLPFGCHAWEKYNTDFWMQFIKI